MKIETTNIKKVYDAEDVLQSIKTEYSITIGDEKSNFSYEFNDEEVEMCLKDKSNIDQTLFEIVAKEAQKKVNEIYASPDFKRIENLKDKNVDITGLVKLM